MSASTITVAILGAGPSGLVAAKEALANGLTPTVFEKQIELGGVWNPATGAVWSNMRTNVSKFTTVFGDTPYPSDTEMFPSSGSVFQYLNDYADNYEFRKHIRFGTKVVSVEPNGDNEYGKSGWKVTWKTGDGLSESQTFSGVIVATGIFSKSSFPDNIPGLESFTGKVLHSNEYKNAKDFQNLRVLTIGGSLSGAEIATDVSTQAKISFHSFRRKFWILRRYLPDPVGLQIPLDLLFYTRSFYAKPTDPEEDEKMLNAKKNRNLLSLCTDQQEFEPLKISPEGISFPINSVVSDNYLPQVQNGVLSPIHGSIKNIQGSQIHFQDGRTIDDVDAIIFATGFQPDVSFFPKRILDKLDYLPNDRLQPLILFQECVTPHLENLFFVGMYKGPYFAVMENQARWATRVLSGAVTLPPIQIMEEGLQKEESIRKLSPRPQFPHPDYVLFADTIASLGQSFPDLQKLQDPSSTLEDAFRPSLIQPTPGSMVLLEHRKEEIGRRFMTEPVTPAHYNLVHTPKQVLNHMDFVQQVLKQFGNIS